MSEEPTDAVPAAPTRRSMQAARPVPPPLPPTESVAPRESAVVPSPALATASESPTEVSSGFTAENVRSSTADATGPDLDASPELAWAPPAPRRPPALAGWALAVAIVGLLVSLVVGWGFPVGIIAIVTAIAALRRPDSRRQAAGWALALGILSVLYSALWIAVAVSRGPLF